jgi:hypothetical protein
MEIAFGAQREPMRLKVFATAIALIVVAVFADYSGVFGVREERIRDYMHLTFQFVDAATRAPISDVHVACTRPMVRSACTETRGPEIGQTTITLSAFKRINRTLLFSEDGGYTLGDDAVMYLTFIPANHARGALEIGSNDPLLSAGRPHVVELTKDVE